MSKFDYGSFYGGYDEFAVNAEKFTKEKAIEIFEAETDHKIGDEVGEYVVTEGYVKWRYGVNEDYEPCVGWWLEYHKREKGSCPAWVFNKRTKYDKEL